MRKTKIKLLQLGPGGRPVKPDKGLYSQVTCVLRTSTVERLKEGANSKYFGAFLQEHLDRYPPPSREQYLATKRQTSYWTTIKRKKVPVIIAVSHEARKLAHNHARRDKLSSEKRKRYDDITNVINQVKATWQQP